MTNLEILKSHLIGTPFESLAKRIRWAMEAPRRLKHPELMEIYLEDDRLEQVIRRSVSESSNCIDIGCHLGSMLNLLVTLAPRGRHMAFEPIPWKAERLAKKFPTVDVRRVALSDSSGEATFHVSVGKSGFSGLRAHHNGSSRMDEIKTPCERLDQIIPANHKIDFIKVDVEGAELMVFRGARELLQRDRPTLIFESTKSALTIYGLSTRDLFDHLVQENGYKIFSPLGFLESGPSLTYEQYNQAHQFPFKAFNFVAVP